MRSSKKEELDSCQESPARAKTHGYLSGVVSGVSGTDYISALFSYLTL